MRVYVDSSALLKRVFDEHESAALIDTLRTHIRSQSAVISSSLAWVEVSRAITRALALTERAIGEHAVGAALSGVAEKPISAEVIALARRVGPSGLRSLDAIHLGSALLLDVDLFIGYDVPLLEAAGSLGLNVASPGT